MLAPEFAANYDPRHSSEPWRTGELAAKMQSCTDWSRKFGAQLHQVLMGEPARPKQASKFLQQYNRWLFTDFIDINASLVGDTTTEGMQASREATFHRLTASMMRQWCFALYGASPNAANRLRQDDTFTERYNLALRGVEYCRQRASTAGIDNDYAYLQPENAAYRANQEGIMTTYDAASLLLGATKKIPGMIVVPAPAQFERSRRHPCNVNFVVWDKRRDRAAGVQVKTHVTKEDQEVYDDSIVLLDGGDDIGNVIYHRDTPGTTIDHRFTWGGMVCAQFILETDMVKQAKTLQKNKIDGRQLFRDKSMAHQVVGQYALKLDRSIATIATKLDAKL